MLKKNNKKIGDIFFLEIDADDTHQCYNDFFKFRINAIIMLSTSIEAFINYSIPNTYPDRTKIERKSSLQEKLKNHLPNSLGLINFWDDKEELLTAILNLYALRNDLIHLKTNSEEGFSAYYEVVSKMLNFDISKAIKDTSDFMNNIEPNFIIERGG